MDTLLFQILTGLISGAILLWIERHFLDGDK